jgi:hypothetical protein
MWRVNNISVSALLPGVVPAVLLFRSLVRLLLTVVLLWNAGPRYLRLFHTT